MRLSRRNLKNISSLPEDAKPLEKIFSLPEKVLQFGTGVLLRGLIDYFIDKANRNGIFNGRIVVVKSTEKGTVTEFDKQDNLYTLCIRGAEEQSEIEEFSINSSISRVLQARENWSEILRCAHNPALNIIISNTTEVGIRFSPDNIHSSPPASFPGKLLAFLVERFKVFGGAKESGMIIIPTELLVDNGSKLLSIVLELAELNKVEANCIEWIKNSNHFCNSLVDRIVPGKLSKDETEIIEKRLGYSDELMITAEPYRLWAIETANKDVLKALSFSRADKGVIIAPDIEKFRELKLRLLNGTHTFSCGLAFLAGLETVKDAMNADFMALYIHHLIFNEIAAVMSNERIPYDDACKFADDVISRFNNPFINHHWLRITLQYSEKMKIRNVPLLIKSYKKLADPPRYMSLGFAAYILYMKSIRIESGNFIGQRNGTEYTIQDDKAATLMDKWKSDSIDKVVNDILTDRELWGVDLFLLNGFADTVKNNLYSLMKNGVRVTIENLLENKTVALS
jgi:tagaturonate reductase